MGLRLYVHLSICLRVDAWVCRCVCVSKYVVAYICIYTCVCVYTYMRICVNVYLCIFVSVYLSIYVSVYMCLCVRMYMYRRMYLCMCQWVRVLLRPPTPFWLGVFSALGGAPAQASRALGMRWSSIPHPLPSRAISDQAAFGRALVHQCVRSIGRAAPEVRLQHTS